MYIVLTPDDLSKLKPETLQDLRAQLGVGASAKPPGAENSGEFDWEDVVDLTIEQVREFMEGCSKETVDGLKVIAEHGPVIRADLLNAVGITNYAHFQGRVTKRTRTVTKNRHAYLFTWDNGSSAENEAAGCGHYAVTQFTFKSLRQYFGMD